MDAIVSRGGGDVWKHKMSLVFFFQDTYFY